MRLPTPLSRRNKNVHKNNFGHALILAGSPSMLGAAALSSLACLRSGCGLVTLGIPQNLNLTAQRKISHAVMTLPLPETKEGTLSAQAFARVKKLYAKLQVIALGPGLTTHLSTAKLILNIIATSPVPLVIDADGLNVLAKKIDVLKKTSTPKILTPHPGEFARLLGKSKNSIEQNRTQFARDFAKKYNCVLLLKGHRTVVASKDRVYINTTGNPGMATAGSGDVLTGMIAAFVAQGLSAFEAAKFGAYYHGKAADKSARLKSEIALIATDILDNIPSVLR